LARGARFGIERRVGGLDAAQETRLPGAPGELLEFACGLLVRRQPHGLLQHAEFLEGGEGQDQLDGQVGVVDREFELDLAAGAHSGDAHEFSERRLALSHGSSPNQRCVVWRLPSE